MNGPCTLRMRIEFDRMFATEAEAEAFAEEVSLDVMKHEWASGDGGTLFVPIVKKLVESA